MKHFAAAVIALVVACKDEKKHPTEPPPPPKPARADQCARALASFDRFIDAGDASATPDARAKVKAAVLDRCITDIWSDAALACMREARSSHDTFACWNEQLTKEQRDAAGTALGDLKM